MEQLTPERMAHVEALAALDECPEDAAILNLTDAERIEFARLTGFLGMKDYVNSWLLMRLEPGVNPHAAPLVGTERMLAEQALIAMLRAYVVAFPTWPEIKRGRRKG